MAEHQVYQVRVIFSIHPDATDMGTGFELAVRAPEDEGWHVTIDIAREDPLKAHIIDAMLFVEETASFLQPRLPFP